MTDHVLTASPVRRQSLDKQLDGLAAALTNVAAAADESGEPAPEALAELRRGGLLGAAVPNAYGGLGLDAAGLNHVIERIARVDASIAIIAFQHFAVTARVTAWGSDAQKAELLPRLVGGDCLAASAWSEAQSGADKSRLATVGRPVPGGGWTVTGAKTFATGAGIADIYLILATTSDHGDATTTYGSRGQTFFLVDASAPGVMCNTSLDLVGMRGSATGFVALEDTPVADFAVLGPVGEAARIIASVREHGMTLGAVSVGLAQQAYDVTFAQVEKVGLLGSQAVRHRLVGLRTDVEAARALVTSAGRCDTAEPGETTLFSKLFASRTAEQVIAGCQQLLGSAGFMRKHPVNRLARDARAVGHMGPTDALCRELVSAGWPA